MPTTGKTQNSISRRTVLRGAGCAVALPWLESQHALADMPAASAFPKRFGTMFLGNGINEDHWSASGVGAEMKLSKTLQPLEPLKQKINVIDGLFIKALTGQGIHPGQTGSLLSGAKISRGAIIHSGTSVDQMIANRTGGDTPQSSIVLACEQPMTGYHETNFSMAYSSHISWQSPESPVPVEVYPSLAWDNLFDNRGSLLNISVLDRVKGRAEELTKKISSTDKSKLDEYLTSVREVEKRVEGMRKSKDGAEDAANGAVQLRAREAAGEGREAAAIGAGEVRRDTGAAQVVAFDVVAGEDSSGGALRAEDFVEGEAVGGDEVQVA